MHCCSAYNNEPEKLEHTCIFIVLIKRFRNAHPNQKKRKFYRAQRNVSNLYQSNRIRLALNGFWKGILAQSAVLQIGFSFWTQPKKKNTKQTELSEGLNQKKNELWNKSINRIRKNLKSCAICYEKPHVICASISN